MVLGSYRELFEAIATAAAALTGLLFVAVSVAPREDPVAGSAVIRQVRAAAALMAFTNALAVSLFSLVPGDDVGYPSAVLGVIGILFTAAGMRSILSTSSTTRQWRQQLGLIVILLLIFGVELAGGIALITGPQRSLPMGLIANALVASLLTGVARAWEFVGDRDTGIIASIAVLTGHEPSPPGPSGIPAREAAASTAAPDIAVAPDIAAPAASTAAPDSTAPAASTGAGDAAGREPDAHRAGEGAG